MTHDLTDGAEVTAQKPWAPLLFGARWAYAHRLAAGAALGASAMPGGLNMDSAPVAARQTLEARLLDAVQQAVVATDIEGKVTFWNAFAERLFGWTAAEALGRSIVDLTQQESTRADAMSVMERLSRGQSWAGEFPVRHKNGRAFIIFVVNSPLLDEQGALVGVVGISTDVSEQRALEAELRQAKKMEAIGRLAGGVAHDFNNLLTVILGNTGLLADELGHHSSSVDAGLKEVEDAAARAAALTRQLLAFSRKQHVRPSVLDLAAAMTSMFPMLRRLISEDIELSLELADQPLRAVMDPAQFDQVVLNLALNARDAMPAGGKLVLRLHPHGPEAEGRLSLRVTDTGTGIPPEALPQIFEPFFTTKEAGRGTGLGLATVYGIVTQAGGTIHVESDARGTSFEVVLPRVRDVVSEAPRHETLTPLPRSSGTVLLVEDEAALRGLIARILSTAGYTVLVAESAEAALELATSLARPIDVLLSDIVMPGMNGVALAEQLRTTRPHLAVMFMTGYSEEDLLRRGTALSDVAVLQKPFVPAVLLDNLARALSAAAK